MLWSHLGDAGNSRMSRMRRPSHVPFGPSETRRDVRPCAAVDRIADVLKDRPPSINSGDGCDGVDKLTLERREASSLKPQFMLRSLMHAEVKSGSINREVRAHNTRGLAWRGVESGAGAGRPGQTNRVLGNFGRVDSDP
jgi:hypothetical protein